MIIIGAPLNSNAIFAALDRDVGEYKAFEPGLGSAAFFFFVGLIVGLIQ